MVPSGNVPVDLECQISDFSLPPCSSFLHGFNAPPGLMLFSLSSRLRVGSRGSRSLEPDRSSGTDDFLWRSSLCLGWDRMILTEMPVAVSVLVSLRCRDIHTPNTHKSQGCMRSQVTAVINVHWKLNISAAKPASAEIQCEGAGTRLC